MVTINGSIDKTKDRIKEITILSAQLNLMTNAPDVLAKIPVDQKTTFYKLPLVTATISGKINFVSFLQENQHIQNNQELFYIIPPSNQFYGELKAAQTGIGKIKEGQNVIVRVNSFPSAEFGYLKGVISYIPTLIKTDSSLLIKVEFSNGLKTNYGKELLFKSNMNASAEIITNNRRLPERLMGQLAEILRR